MNIGIERGADTAVSASSDGNRFQDLELGRSSDQGGRPIRRRLPETRASITHKFDIVGHEGYLTVGLFQDGQPGELFITMAKEGSTIGGLMDCIGTLTSLALQYGVPLEALARKFAHQRFEPSGSTKNPAIGNASSIIDYVFRWMAMQFVPDGTPSSLADPKPPDLTRVEMHLQQNAPACPSCGHVAVRIGSTYQCRSCGQTLGHR